MSAVLSTVGLQKRFTGFIPGLVPLVVGLLCGTAIGHSASAPLHDFGSVSVNAAAASYALTANVPGVTAVPVWSMTDLAFSISGLTCTVTAGNANCSAAIGFAPLFPGLQTGALLAKDSSGHLLATFLFKGVGLSSQIVFTPGVISTLAGSGVWAYSDGAAAGASFRNPAGVAVDQAGNIYVADSVNQVIRRIAAGIVSPFAGTGQAGYSGDGGPARSATLQDPTGVAVDAANNIFISDQGNGLIRRVDAVSGIITTVAGGGSTLITAGSSNVAARNASLGGLQAVVVDPAGNLFISDSLHQKVVRVDAGTNVISVYAGGGTGGGSDGLGDGEAATLAILTNPTGLALDSANNLYIADTGNSMIRMVNASTGVITAAAGSGRYGYAGDLGPATSASLASPQAVRVDAAGNLFIADFGNNVIRVTRAGDGTINTLAGNGTAGDSGNGGLATSAMLFNPIDLALLPAGGLVIADYSNNVIRQVNLTASALNFSNVIDGTASQAQAVTLLNGGNQSLTLSGLTVSSGFKQVASTSSCSASSVLAAGGTCTISLEFVPVSAGTVNGSLSLVTNSLNATGTKTSSLIGMGLAGNAPLPAFNTASLNFGTVASGSSQSQVATLANQGSSALSIAGIVLNGKNAFTLATTCGTSLAAGANCALTVTFSPVASGTYSATLTIADSAGSSPQSVSISGTGVGGPVGVVSNTSLYFSSVLSNGSVGQPVTLTNTGTTSLRIDGISLSGANSADFNLATTCLATLAVSQSCSTFVYFSPSAAGVRTATVSIASNGAGSPQVVSLSGAGATTPLQFVVIQPCRVIDTRMANGPFGGPGLLASVARDVVIPNSACGIPTNAAAYALNVTVVPGGVLGALTIWPAGLPQPLVSTLNSVDGRIKANAAIVAGGVGGGVDVAVSQVSHLIIDINGYFVAGDNSALSFYPLTPCRIVDTRNATGPLGGPYLSGLVPRSLPIPSSGCNVPSAAKAYSLNFTAVPHGPLGFLTTWPTGASQPLVSTLNASTGVTTANAALIPAGASGAISVFATNDTDLVVDINGYFAAAATGGLSLYTLTPCRVLDTRLTSGLFTGILNVNVGASACSATALAKSYVLNATVVPTGGLGALTLWANGSAEPLVSTLNAVDGVVTSNMAIVPSSSGSISASASNPAQLILDVAAYFAP